MFKEKDEMISDAETTIREGRGLESERFKSQIEFILEVDELSVE